MNNKYKKSSPQYKLRKELLNEKMQPILRYVNICQYKKNKNTKTLYYLVYCICKSVLRIKMRDINCILYDRYFFL